MGDLLPVSALTTTRDRFRCGPLRADLSVATCHARRGATYDGGRMKNHGPKVHAKYPGCVECTLGAEVARRVPPAVSVTPCDVCGVPVTGAKGRRPRCPPHRKGVSHVG